MFLVPIPPTKQEMERLYHSNQIQNIEPSYSRNQEWNCSIPSYLAPWVWNKVIQYPRLPPCASDLPLPVFPSGHPHPVSLPHPGAPPIPVPSSDFCRRRSLLPQTCPQSRQRPSCRPIGRRRSPIPQMRPQSRRRTTLIPARLGLPSATLAPSRRSAERPVAVSPPPPASCSIRPGELQHPSSAIDLRARYL